MQEAVLRRLFGVALLAHVVGNWHQPDLPSLTGLIELLVGCVAIVLILAPTQVAFLVSAVATICSVLAEIPQTGNHWVLAGLASLLIVVNRGRGPALTSGLRWLFVVFYGFAAFAKLNTGFFDPSTSCAVFYTNQSLASWGLMTLSPDSAPAEVAVWSTVLIELSVVPLIVWRRTRWLGLVVASLFHGIISLDFDQHFYDFTAVLVFLLASFLPWSEGGERGPDRRLEGTIRWFVVPVATGLVLSSVLPPALMSIRILSIVPFMLWIPFLVGWIALVLTQGASVAASWRLAPAATLVIVLAVINGLTPYTELKTAYSFNMYSNLLTAQGMTNHLLVPRTFPLRDGYTDPVEIVESSDPGLELYRDRGYLIAYPQFQRYLVDRSFSVTFIRGGMETTLADTQATALASTGPWWWRFMPLRALDQQSPPRCQDVFLPAL